MNKPINIHWQLAVSTNSLNCKICRHKNNEFRKHSFAMELCQIFNIYPIYKTPYWQNRLRALLRKHYKEMRKIDKVKEINQAIANSKTALDRKAKAEILQNGTIEYSMTATTRLGREYRIRVTFRKILGLLWGEDIRRLTK